MDYAKTVKGLAKKFPIALTLIFIIVTTVFFIFQKMDYHRLLNEYKSLKKKEKTLKEENRMLSSRLDVLYSSKRVVQIATREMNLVPFEENEVIYLEFRKHEVIRQQKKALAKKEESFIADFLEKLFNKRNSIANGKRNASVKNS